MFSDNPKLIDNYFLKAGYTYFCKKDFDVIPLMNTYYGSKFYKGKSYECRFDGMLINEQGGFFFEKDVKNPKEYFE